MNGKRTGQTTGNPGRIDPSWPELDTLGVAVDDAVDGGVVDANAVAHALIESKDAEEFAIVTLD
ncbi:hypothetical protein [Haloplanus salilacus]|uniref:hypothetical protein n=1 Tax=Haloplanus salilacus TaxID=2949994 RepID=UPI0030D2E5C4